MKTLERCQEKLDEFRMNGLKLVREKQDLTELTGVWLLVNISCLSTSVVKPNALRSSPGRLDFSPPVTFGV